MLVFRWQHNSNCCRDCWCITRISRCHFNRPLLSTLKRKTNCTRRKTMFECHYCRLPIPSYLSQFLDGIFWLSRWFFFFVIGHLVTLFTLVPPPTILIESCFENAHRGSTAAVTVVQYVEGSCVWRRGPRPAKGRNSRTRRTPSPVAGPAAAAALLTTTAAMTTATSTTVAPGYEQYQKSLLEVPWPHAEYGEASSDDLSSEWDSDVPEPPPNSKVNNGIIFIICLYNNT